MRITKKNIIPAILIISSPFCIFSFNADSLSRLEGNISALSFQESISYSPDIIEYFDFYDMNVKGADHYFGYFMSSDKKIAAHIYHPKNPIGTIVFIHGYLDHSGLYMGIINYFLERNFNIAIFDLPGHGLSGGKRIDIENFSEYGLVLNDFFMIISNDLTQPYYAVGHSTGSASLIEYFYNYENRFMLSFLVSPLIRTYLWDLSLIGMNIMDIFSDGVFRRFGGASSDREYLNFVKRRDPLQSKTVPFHWARVLRLWNEKIMDYRENPSSIVVLQGTDDTVVDYKYNIQFLKDRFQNIKIINFDDARHSLFNEKTDLNPYKNVVMVKKAS
jgi:alpha-beta hydrolase superfamily lysophospholipase